MNLEPGSIIYTHCPEPVEVKLQEGLDSIIRIVVTILHARCHVDRIFIDIPTVGRTPTLSCRSEDPQMK